MASDRGGLNRIGLALACLLLAGWTVWFFLGRVTLYEVSRSAHVEVTGSSRELASASGGRLVASGLYVGRRVKAGEVLAELDSDVQKSQLAEAEARLASFPGRIAALQAQRSSAHAAGQGAIAVAGADARAARARKGAADADASYRSDYAGRLSADAASGGTAQVDADRAAAEARSAAAERTARAAEQQRAAGDARLAAANSSGAAARADESLAGLRGDQAATAALVDRLRLELDQRQIRAPADGVIGDVANLQIGQVLPPGARLATLVPIGSLHIVAQFDQSRGLGRLAEGQGARLLLDGFNWTQYGDISARVDRVAAEGHDNLLQVELGLPRQGTGELPLRHGMTGQVEVAIERVSPVTLVLRAIGQYS